MLAVVGDVAPDSPPAGVWPLYTFLVAVSNTPVTGESADATAENRKTPLTQIPDAPPLGLSPCVRRLYVRETAPHPVGRSLGSAVSIGSVVSHVDIRTHIALPDARRLGRAEKSRQSVHGLLKSNGSFVDVVGAFDVVFTR